MTLSRQFITLLVVMFFLVFSGNYWSVLSNTREYLSLQLQSHAQDAATSLGLSLTPYTDSVSIMESMISVIFDSGNYSDIRLVDLDGNLVINRHNEIQANVPDWFSDMMPLKTPESETLITSGWQQKFHLFVKSDSSYAYSDLWKTACDGLTWSLEAFAVALLCTIMFIRLLLRPLRSLEEHAVRICNRDFPDPMHVPRTRELGRVVNAINLMSLKVKSMLDNLYETAEKLRSDLNTDMLTGLLNRRGISAVVHRQQADNALPSQGYFALISLSGLEKLNLSKGYSEGDGALSLSTGIIEHTCNMESFPETVFARIGGSDFALLMPGGDSETVVDRIADLCHELNSRLERYSEGLVVHIGIARYNGKMDFGELCKLADGALGKAQSEITGSRFCFADMESDDSQNRGKQEWRDVIRGALDNDYMALSAQQILFKDKQDESRKLFEVCAKIADDKGNSISAGDFIFWAERLNMVEELDQRIIILSLARLEQDKTMELSVNISELSMYSAGFLEWFKKTLQVNQDKLQRLILELPEKGVVAHPDKAQQFVEIIKKYGAGVAIDRFGVSRSSIDYLRQIKPDYIKIDGSYIYDIENDSEDQVMLKAYVDIAHGLDMKVIATFIETEAAYRVVCKLGVNAAQGLFLGVPT
ncbi:MAG: EAL domain-containing protein [Candidatus Brocadiaceae bacterium]|nr:EAL domain-containing protein [Candidatus Brocadiaceae bacterium]